MKEMDRLTDLQVNSGCSPDTISQFEAVYGLLADEYRDFLLWSNGVDFGNYDVSLTLPALHMERVGYPTRLIELHFDHFASLDAIQGCIDFTNSEVSDLTQYDLKSPDYFINNFHPIAYDVTGKDYVCMPKGVSGGIYLVNWWEPGAYQFLPFPQVKIAESLSGLVNMLLSE